jgi:hypothetical protein
MGFPVNNVYKSGNRTGDFEEERMSSSNRRGGSNDRPSRTRPATQVGGSGAKPPARSWCPMVAAVRSAKQGQFRLARRYAVMSARLMTARIT